MKDTAIRLALLLWLAAMAQVHAFYADLTKPLAVASYAVLMVVIVAYAGFVLWRIWKPRT